MSLDFSLFADDMVIEILGNLPALDIVRYRRVCRRIFLASKERSVWVNVFSRAQCPLPHADLNTMSTQDIEKLLVRMEIMDAKWTGRRSAAPQVFGRAPEPSSHTGHQTFFVPMSPYILRVQPHSNSTMYSWYRKGDLKHPVLEHQLPECISCHDVDVGSNTLNIAYLDRSRKPRHMNIVRFEVSKEDVVSKTLEHDISWPHPLPDELHYELKIQNGYVVPRFYVVSPEAVDLFHLDTGGIITCPVYKFSSVEVHDPPMLFIVSSYLIQLHRTEFAVFKLPSLGEREASMDPRAPSLTHTGSLPHQFGMVHFFPRSSFSFAVIGLVSDQGQDEQQHSAHLYFVTLTLDQHSSECWVRQDFVYEASGRPRSLILAPCSSSSRSTLGLFSIHVSPPTHTPGGRRIARQDSAPQIYHLAVRVDFGVEGYIPPNIDLTELGLFPDDGTPKTVNISRFDPYAGQIIIHWFGSSRHIIDPEIAAIDYASPD